MCHLSLAPASDSGMTFLNGHRSRPGAVRLRVMCHALSCQKGITNDTLNKGSRVDLGHKRGVVSLCSAEV